MTSLEVQEHLYENGQVEIVPRSFSIQFDPLAVCGTGLNDEGDAQLADDNSLTTMEGKMQNSLLVESDDEDSDAEGEEEFDHVQDENMLPLNLGVKQTLSQDKTFHPDLKPAVLAEGQEAMWVEDDVSTVASVYVKQEKKQIVPKKKKNRFRFRPSLAALAIPENESVEDSKVEMQKVHVRKIKKKKTVVLLPQNEAEGAKALVEENVQQEAAQNMAKARRLLDRALDYDGDYLTVKGSESLAKEAFTHATTARRLMSSGGDEPDLEEVLSGLAEEGENAVIQHQKLAFSFSSMESEDNESTDSPVQDNDRGVLSKASTFAVKARHYLESILPTNVNKEFEEEASIAVDSISTLGFKTDTFEYGLQPAPSQPAKSYTNMDLMSISSLNEILDGPMNEAVTPRLPQDVLQVISIPNGDQVPEEEETKEEEDGVVSDDTESQEETVVSEPSTVPVNKNPRKKWRFLGKFRRGKKKTNEITKETAAEEDVSNLSAEQEAVIQESKSAEPVKAETGLTAEEEAEVSEETSKTAGEENSSLPEHIAHLASIITSKSLDTDADQDSKLSRYHIPAKPESASLQQSKSEDVGNMLRKKGSDWDDNFNWQNPREKIIPVQRVQSMPIRTLEPAGSAWDLTLDPTKSSETRTKPALAHLSLDGSVTEDDGSKTELLDSSQIATPAQRSRVDSVNTNNTQAKDLSSTLGNTGVNTVAGTETDASQQEVESKAESRTQGSTTQSATTPSTKSSRYTTRTGSTGTSRNTSRSGSTTTSAHKSRPEDEATTTAESASKLTQNESLALLEDGTLINFVISPRRANIITPGGTKPFEQVPSDAPSKILVPTLEMIGENEEMKADADIPLDNVEQLPEKNSQNKGPKLISRFTKLFGNKQKDNLKDINKDSDKQAEIDNLALEKAMSNALQKATEANQEVQEDSGRKRTKPKRELPDLVDAIRMQAGLDKEGSRDNRKTDTPDLMDTIRIKASMDTDTGAIQKKPSSDAPGSSPQTEEDSVQEKKPDAPKEDTNDYRVLAPTPRRKTVENAFEGTEEKKEENTEVEGEAALSNEDDNGETEKEKAETPTEETDNTVVLESEVEKDAEKYDQKRVTELLYGTSKSDIVIEQARKDKTNGVTKGMYIGDLLNAVATAEGGPIDDQPIPERVDTEDSEESNDTEEQDDATKTWVEEEERPAVFKKASKSIFSGFKKLLASPS